MSNNEVSFYTGIPLEICNDEHYGFIPVPLEDEDELENDYQQLLNVKLEALGRGTPLPLNKDLADYVMYPQQWKYGCDAIYMINLERRSERRDLMLKSCVELGMEVTIVKAIDGK